MRTSLKTMVLTAAGCAALTLGATGAQAVPVQWTIASGGNGHFYDFIVPSTVPSEALSWGEARIDALSRTHYGQQGYLITLTSAEEQVFYRSQFGAVDGWIGGNDLEEEGKWVWADGPEAGQQFWSGGSGGSVTAPFNYASWTAGEPNNNTFYTPNGEDVAEFDGGNWNDLLFDPLAVALPCMDPSVISHCHLGYLIEFNAPVPEPITLSLLGAGLAGIGLMRRRRRVSS